MLPSGETGGSDMPSGADLLVDECRSRRGQGRPKAVDRSGAESLERRKAAEVLVVLGVQGYGTTCVTRPQPVPSQVQRQGAGFGEEVDGYLRGTLYPLLNEKRQGEIDALYSRRGFRLLGE